ncbi:DUF3696 domain-containing protein [Accumulibacter sp.]|uniref:AAA family ATPase n=1 Tax=Accumulibacter sp. TaxID=2053492 RepID=UPI0025EA7BF9|nr:DUF3696 domain-containing protein [Accumulibacter sp.]MCM8611071.1 DUF3696 domain-containing protein [Accumulibacter sp.]MCM8636185.1 DUF3696 domain-containing protein [Accumulibacter sp.]MCM8640584.1 DUF3696 domain-containing protein [Accumulibacter sp.]
MRITAIEIENFKGISERVRVELKPITLLFGANSAGKSTILQALLYMKDVLDRRNLDAITTPVSGRALDLGGFRRFVHGHDLSRTVRIALSLDLTGQELPRMARPYDLGTFSGHKTTNEFLDRHDQAWWDILCWIKSAKVQIEVRWDKDFCRPVASAYTVGLNGLDFIRIEWDGGRRKVTKMNWLNPAVSRPLTEDELRLFHLDLDEDRELTPQEKEDLKPYARVSALQTVRPCFAGKESTLSGLSNWLPRSQDPISDFSYREDLNLPEAIDWRDFEFKGNDCRFYEDLMTWQAWEGTEFLARLAFGPGKLLREWLQDLRYIGPLRARFPRKGIPGAELSDWSEGLAAWKVLESEESSSDFIQQVSQWLAGEDRLNSGYELERKHRAQVDVGAFRQIAEGDRDGARLLELLKEAPKSVEIKLVDKQSCLELDPSDVGVGISQVLPIVVAAVAPGKSVVAIEQPELHIHPAMQVALGDLFIEGAKMREMSFLIETHSEHLMLRLLRRIRETTEGELPPGGVKISPEDVSVVYVQSGANGVEMVPLLIDETGEFATKWPRGFFDERAEELFG